MVSGFLHLTLNDMPLDNVEHKIPNLYNSILNSNTKPIYLELKNVNPDGQEVLSTLIFNRIYSTNSRITNYCCAFPIELGIIALCNIYSTDPNNWYFLAVISG